MVSIWSMLSQHKGEWGEGGHRGGELGLPVMGTNLAPNRRLPKVKPAALTQRRPMPKLEVAATMLVASMSLIMAKAPKYVNPLTAP